jgi:Type II CAAX prenyl endopeptidase Rce1-like
MHTVVMSRPSSETTRDVAEVVFGFGFILLILWVPEPMQRLLSPIALVGTLAVVLLGRSTRETDPLEPQVASNPHPGAEELGLGLRGLVPSLWILPAAAVLTVVSVLVARKFGFLHPLYKGDFKHIAGYVIWTCYQQFLLQDYFMPRLLRLLPSAASAIAVTGTLFAVAHMPNVWLAVATLLWGIVSCALFRRYRNLYALGLAQGLLGLGFAICVPDALHHHLRVGLGYLLYHATKPIP